MNKTKKLRGFEILLSVPIALTLYYRGANMPPETISDGTGPQARQ